MSPTEAAKAAPSSTSYALELDDVCKRFGKRWALARLTYRLPAGRSLLLTGHNGSGKTTLLRVISTILSPTAGTVRVHGEDVVKDRESVRRKVALLSHSSFLYEDLTAEQNLLVLCRLLGIPHAKDVTGALLTRVGLGTRSKHPVRQFSAGMRKRLAIARVLLKAPRVALLDEPFGELDPMAISQMEKMIHELQETGTTVVLATHLIDQGQSLTQERLHLNEGRVA